MSTSEDCRVFTLYRKNITILLTYEIRKKKRVIENKECLPLNAGTGKKGPSKTPQFPRSNKKCVSKINPEGKQNRKKIEHKAKAK